MADPTPGADLALMFLQPRPDPTQSTPGLTAQISHRLQIVSFFNITPGSRILELGCGQGDTTIALAHAVGPGGHIGTFPPSPCGGKKTTTKQEVQVEVEGSKYRILIRSRCHRPRLPRLRHPTPQRRPSTHPLLSSGPQDHLPHRIPRPLSRILHRAAIRLYRPLAQYLVFLYSVRAP